jgi:Transposase DDE domain
MYFRAKRSGGFEYLQVVESHRVNGKPRQTVVATLGRLDALKESGELDRLLQSGARFTESGMLVSAFEKGGTAAIDAKRIGPPLLFERLWRDSYCRSVIEDLLADRKFEFPVERAVFLTVLHRIMDPGSDRAAEKWRSAYSIGGMETIDLHHLYRAMSWLGEELADQQGRGLAPRTNKDLVEERLFAKRRDLFNDVGLAIFDTTSLYFEGEGGTALGENGHSKDSRPDLHQMVLGVVIDENGRPICSEMWPGNTADVTTLISVVTRLRERFLLNRVCIIADRGMVSAKTIATLEANKIEYILGVREKRNVEVAAVLADKTPFVPLTIPKTNGRGTLDLQVKEVVRKVKEGQAGRTRHCRYIVCYNEAEPSFACSVARNDAAPSFACSVAREAILAGLDKALRQGDKAMVGNRGFRRFIKTEGESHFAIDPERVAAAAKFDGLYVIRTNARLSPLAVALRYRQRWIVEDIFRTAKSIIDTRPIFHRRDETIRGHVFCSFLALLLRKELIDRLAAAGRRFEWADIIRDLDQIVQTDIDQAGKRLRLRAAAPGCAGALFQAVGVALPPMIQIAAQPPPPSLAPSPHP